MSFHVPGARVDFVFRKVSIKSIAHLVFFIHLRGDDGDADRKSSRLLVPFADAHHGPQLGIESQGPPGGWQGPKFLSRFAAFRGAH